MLQEFIVLHFGLCLDRNRCVQVILYVCKDSENEDITNFHGLGKTNPLLAAILTASLLSMAGILFSQGFF
jgi:NADH:ubiquinone oxidoreductase subunit 2 (subunit N)